MPVLTVITSEQNSGITVFRPLTDYSSQQRGGSTAIEARTRHMLRSPLIWYLATLFASLGLLVAIALDGLRGRPTDHKLPRTLASAGATGSPGALDPQKVETKQPVVGASSGSVTQVRASPADAARAAAPPAPVSVPMHPPATQAAPTIPVAQTGAPWPSVTVTSSIGDGSNDASSSLERKRPNDCLALWDRETHMTKEEWKAACGRIPGQP